LTTHPPQIRAATAADVPLLHSMIVQLAEYEREPDAVTGSPEMLGRWLFAEPPGGEAILAQLGDQVAGFALFFSTFSTWECTPGIWLEDLFVRAEHRRTGVGGALLAHVARIAAERGCTRLEWAALDWNTPALDFYARLGADRLDEWRLHRLDGAALAAVAGHGGRS
jgi:GNAT superfamily N-acetyltransferase